MVVINVVVIINNKITIVITQIIGIIVVAQQ